MRKQSGFTLFELMIAIAIIAILSAIAVPAYRGYIQKAALTDVLQTVNRYRTAIELCYLEEGNLFECANGKKGIPHSKSTRYLENINVSQGSVTASGRGLIQGLSIILTPIPDDDFAEFRWRRRCVADMKQAELVAACESVFRFSE
jgi:prepilin peptidase dependent protein D